MAAWLRGWASAGQRYPLRTLHEVNGPNPSPARAQPQPSPVHFSPSQPSSVPACPVQSQPSSFQSQPAQFSPSQPSSVPASPAQSFWPSRPAPGGQYRPVALRGGQGKAGEEGAGQGRTGQGRAWKHPPVQWRSGAGDGDRGRRLGASRALTRDPREDGGCPKVHRAALDYTRKTSGQNLRQQKSSKIRSAMIIFNTF